ncbi:MAG TPA: iron donor protein CyaY [Rhodospirillales bacterium]|nr:iron donor protein CyaY [Rhodospirillales bacterium]
MTLDKNKFDGLANETLAHLLDVIDEKLGDVMEVDMENEMLTIDLENGGQYIINKHAPNRQIWLSSPLSGASHYDFDETGESWIDSRSGENLMPKLAAELARLSGMAFSLD